MAIRLLGNRPIHKRLEDVFSLMDKLGIQFTARSGIIVHSFEHGECYLRELETGDGVCEVPPALEYKIVKEQE